MAVPAAMSHHLTKEELDEQFEQFLKESVSDESVDLGGSAQRTSVLDSLGKAVRKKPAKKAAVSSAPWWQDVDDDDDDYIAGGTGRASSPEPLHRPVPKPRSTRRSGEEPRSVSQRSPPHTSSSRSPPGDGHPDVSSCCDETLPRSDSDEDGTSRRSFLKSSRTSQPIREEEEEEEDEYLGGKTFSDEGRQQGVLSTVIQEEDSMLASGPHLNTGGPGLETLEEEEEKARFFERLEAGASSTLDYSKLNRELDSPGSTTTTTTAAAASLRKPEEPTETLRPAADRISPARSAASPDYSDNFEDEESETAPPEKKPQMSSLVAKVSLYDSLESTESQASSRQHRGKEPSVSVDKGQSYGQSGGSELEAVQEAYRQISDAPGASEDRGEGGREGEGVWSSRASPPTASPLERHRGDHPPASTTGSELPTAEELMRPIRPETSDRVFTLQASRSRWNTQPHLLPGFGLSFYFYVFVF